MMSMRASTAPMLPNSTLGPAMPVVRSTHKRRATSRVRAAGVRPHRAVVPSDPAKRRSARAIRGRAEAMLRAVQAVRPALDKFYASLSDEQKERFNQLDAANLQTASAVRQADIARVCGGRGARALDVPMTRFERTLHLSD